MTGRLLESADVPVTKGSAGLVVLPPQSFEEQNCIPVSYTHLDVYKRQAFDPVFSTPRKEVVGRPDPFLHGVLEFVRGGKSGDVYKRQGA